MTATPQKEMETILVALDLAAVFMGVFGAPEKKTDAMQKVLRYTGVPNEHCLLIGDSLADQQPASAANIPFLLRAHSDNYDLLRRPSLPRIPDFLNL